MWSGMIVLGKKEYLYTSILGCSILSPLLFIMFMNDLPNALTNSRALLFANDTKCFRYITTPIDQQSFQNDLENL